jgi:hypothetical protein
VPILRRNKHKNETEEFCCPDNRLRNPLAAAAYSRTADRGRKSLYPPNRKFSVAEIALHALLSDTVACGCSMRLPLEDQWISLSIECRMPDCSGDDDQLYAQRSTTALSSSSVCDSGGEGCFLLMRRTSIAHLSPSTGYSSRASENTALSN